MRTNAHQIGEFELPSKIRTKGWVLSNSEKLQILEMIYYDKLKVSEISRKLRVSQSAIYRLKRDFKESDFSIDHEKKSPYFNIYSNKKVLSSIKEYVENNRAPFVVKDVVNKLHPQFNISCLDQQVRKFMKNKLKMSYQKVSSRP